MLTSTEALVLSLLSRQQGGAFGSQLVHLSEGKIKRGSIYAVLGRLDDGGYVRASTDAPTEEYALPRVRYEITALGNRARNDFADWHGLTVPKYLVGVV